MSSSKEIYSRLFHVSFNITLNFLPCFNLIFSLLVFRYYIFVKSKNYNLLFLLECLRLFFNDLFKNANLFTILPHDKKDILIVGSHMDDYQIT